MLNTQILSEFTFILNSNYINTINFKETILDALLSTYFTNSTEEQLFFKYCVEMPNEEEEVCYAPMNAKGEPIFGSESFLYDFNIEQFFGNFREASNKSFFFWTDCIYDSALNLLHEFNISLPNIDTNTKKNNNEVLKFFVFNNIDFFINYEQVIYNILCKTTDNNSYIINSNLNAEELSLDFQDNTEYSYDYPQFDDICLPKFIIFNIDETKFQIQLVENFPIFIRIWRDVYIDYLNYCFRRFTFSDYYFFFLKFNLIYSSIIFSIILYFFVKHTFFWLYLQIWLKKYLKLKLFSISPTLSFFQKNEPLFTIFFKIIFFCSFFYIFVIILEVDLRLTLQVLYHYLNIKIIIITCFPPNLFDSFHLNMSDIPIKNFIFIYSFSTKSLLNINSLLHLT